MEFPTKQLRGLTTKQIVAMTCETAENTVNKAFEACESHEDMVNAITFLSTLSGEMLVKTFITDQMSMESSMVNQGQIAFTTPETRKIEVFEQIDEFTKTMKLIAGSLLEQVQSGKAEAKVIKLKG